LTTYEDLADPKWKGKITVCSSAAMYAQSRLATLIVLDGEDEALRRAQSG
jgi:iron(III) transport system substrate-binding protein